MDLAFHEIPIEEFVPDPDKRPFHVYHPPTDQAFNVGPAHPVFGIILAPPDAPPAPAVTVTQTVQTDQTAAGSVVPTHVVDDVPAILVPRADGRPQYFEVKDGKRSKHLKHVGAEVLTFQEYTGVDPTTIEEAEAGKRADLEDSGE